MTKNIKISMVMVISLDGIISKNKKESVSTWSSVEDNIYLKKMIKNSDGIITGRKSFKESLIRPDKFFYVLTSNKKLKSNKNLRYIYGSTRQLLNVATKDRVKKLLLLGGAQTNYLFLKEKLVNDLFLTIEPQMFGVGKHLNINKKLNINLKLLGIKVLNSNGTLRLHYKILNK